MNGFDETTEEKKPIPWKPIAIVVGAVLLVVVIVVGALMFVRARQERELERQLTDRTLGQVERTLETCEQAPDPEACRIRRLRETAAGTGMTEVCEMIEDDSARDNCIWSVARDRNRVEVCDLMLDEQLAQNCRDGLLYRQVRDGLSSDCTVIAEDGLREQCERTVISMKVANEGCLSVYDEAYCQAQAQMEQIVVTGDSSLCGSITDGNVRSECIERAEGFIPIPTVPDETADSDSDGLSDGDEVNIWGTDPLNPDTDGDSFLDGQEVEAGFNPLGEGML